MQTAVGQIFVRQPAGEAAAFQRAAERHLNGSLIALSALLHTPPRSRDALPDVLGEIFASPDLLSTAHAADVHELDDLHENAVAGRASPTSRHLRPSSRQEVWERLLWMLTQPVVFYPKSKVWRSRPEVERLADAYARWWLGSPPPDSTIPLQTGWRLVRIEADALYGFGNGFYDAVFLACRGCELRLLLQDGSD